jgi:hypothetical protein
VIVVVVAIVVMSVALAEMSEGRIVAAVKSFSECVAVTLRNGGTLVFPPVIHIRVMVALKVIASGFDAGVKTLALNVLELLGRRVPAATIMVGVLPVLILRARPVLRHQQGRCSQCKSKRWKSNSINLHVWVPPCISCTLAEMAHPHWPLSLKAA